jgi:hypothetical protein
MYTKILLAGIVVCMLSCKEEQKPAHILTEPQMVNALIELYIAEERVDAIGIQYDSIKAIFPKFESRVFDKLGIADSVFKQSMNYYSNNPKKLEKLFTAVVDSLSLRAQELSVAPSKDNVVSQ